MQGESDSQFEWDDEMEVCFERGWSDGLPVTPPTDARILRMLQGTNRKPDEIIGMVPPNLVPISVEKVAINAVLAGLITLCFWQDIAECKLTRNDDFGWLCWCKSLFTLNGIDFDQAVKQSLQDISFWIVPDMVRRSN